jgi:hypothetical protein
MDEQARAAVGGLRARLAPAVDIPERNVSGAGKRARRAPAVVSAVVREGRAARCRTARSPGCQAIFSTTSEALTPPGVGGGTSNANPPPVLRIDRTSLALAVMISAASPLASQQCGGNGHRFWSEHPNKGRGDLSRFQEAPLPRSQQRARRDRPLVRQVSSSLEHCLLDRYGTKCNGALGPPSS